MTRFCDDAIVQQTIATNQLIHTIKCQQQHFQRVKTANEIVQKRKFDGLEKQKQQLKQQLRKAEKKQLMLSGLPRPQTRFR